MVKKLLLFVFLSAFCFPAMSQHEADKWFFGTLAGLDFSSGSPVVISSNLSAAEGCATISNSAGKLLFYTEGLSVYDSTHTVMPNGSGIMGDVSSSQTALIVPSPVGNSQYYLFTTDADGGPDGFRYSIVDMNLGTHGDVLTTAKNVMVVDDSVCEKIAAVKASSGNGYWIVIHKWGNDEFLAYHLTTAGLLPPVVSHAGSVHSTSTFQNTYGQMKFNNCGTKLALAMGYQNTAELFDFDQSTGTVSNPVTFPFGDHVYGVEFSKSSNLLYISSYDNTGTICQYDITLSTPALIVASRVGLSATDYLYGMQMGPDGKIYVARSFSSSFLGVINSPETIGFSANYTDTGIDLDPGFMGVNPGLSLPGFMQTYLAIATGTSCPSTAGIDENTAGNLISVYPNPSSEGFIVNLSEMKSDVQIFDYSGKCVESHSAVNEVFNFGKTYAKGVYFIRIISEKGTQVSKIIKL